LSEFDFDGRRVMIQAGGGERSASAGAPRPAGARMRSALEAKSEAPAFWGTLRPAVNVGARGTPD
jgi:hypothetical protein